MTAQNLLIVVALIQGVLLVGLMLLILINRWVREWARTRLLPRRAVLDAAMRGWAMGETDARFVIRALEDLPQTAAVESLVAWAARVSGERWRTLAVELVPRPWVARLRQAARSRAWWKRLRAARFLSVVSAPEDLHILGRLLEDDHPAVHMAAAAALERAPEPSLVALVLQRVPHMTSPVQAYYAAVLRTAHPMAVPLLVERLSEVYDPALSRLVEFAGRLGDAGLREPITTLADHRSVEVRVQVARALGGLPHPRSVTALRALATDAAWEVRAQATRSLGRIADPSSLDPLKARLVDAEWWVRLRAALALTRLGASGRDVLLAAEIGPQADARYVARLVLGLSAQALAEFAA
ncbi:MAG TPA: HEAT repeat domain-containing protein [Gemmatimonadales bacterium]|nr:HEAT repeat domain-containing protein [Gemmatimonadales bacterium]